MQLGFDCESLGHAKAAMLLYAMYRSRGKESSLNGLETWNRCNTYIRAAVLKSNTVTEFVQAFCKKAGIQSIKPHHLTTDGIVKIDESGTMVQATGVYDYRTKYFEDPNLLDIFANEAIYIVMLVRERIQRERMVGEHEIDD